jgi:hypothetical protein
MKSIIPYWRSLISAIPSAITATLSTSKSRSSAFQTRIAQANLGFLLDFISIGFHLFDTPDDSS